MDIIKFLNSWNYKYCLLRVLNVSHGQNIIEIGVTGIASLSTLSNVSKDSFITNLNKYFRTNKFKNKFRPKYKIKKGCIVFKIDKYIQFRIHIYTHIVPNIFYSETNRFIHLYAKEMLFPKVVKINEVSTNVPEIYYNEQNILFLTLGVDKERNLCLDVLDMFDKDVFYFTINYNTIMHDDRCLSYNDDGTLTFCNNSYTIKWKFLSCDQKDQYYLQSVYNNRYISHDEDYKIILTDDINDAIPFYVSTVENHQMLHYIKPELLVSMEANSMDQFVIQSEIQSDTDIIDETTVDMSDISDIISDESIKLNIGILLASGQGSRYSSNKLKQLKQLSKLDGKPLLYYSMEAFNSCPDIDFLIVCANSFCYDTVKQLKDRYHFHKICVIKADTDDRVDTILLAYHYIMDNICGADNIVIHDGVRPLIKPEHITKLLGYMDKYDYATYYMDLRNGLMLREFTAYDNMFDKAKYIETSTPNCIRWKYFSHINRMYIDVEPRLNGEYIPFLKIMKKRIKLIKGDIKFLHKVTYADDMDLIEMFYNFTTDPIV